MGRNWYIYRYLYKFCVPQNVNPVYGNDFVFCSENHSAKVVNFMLDMMCPVVKEADSVAPELLDILLINIIEPHKVGNRLKSMDPEW